MSDEPGSANDEDLETPAPLDLAGLEFRLRYCAQTGFNEQFDLLQEITSLGSSALPVLPILVEQYRAGNIKAAIPSLMIDLWIKTRYGQLLAALMESNCLKTCNIFDKCKLFENGVSDLEQEILDYLWQHWSKAGEPGRGQAIETLGRCGGPNALRMLEVIRSQMAGRVQEQGTKLTFRADQLEHEEMTAEDVLDALAHRANDSFLNKVRSAIKLIRERQSQP